MASSGQTQVKRGDRVRHTNGNEGVAMSDATSGTIQVKTDKGVIASWSVYDLAVTEEGDE